MAGYRVQSNWNERNELRCLLIFKKLQAEKFPYGRQIQYCRKIEEVSGLDVGNLSAKVCNYKSVAGINNASNASSMTCEIYQRFGQLSIDELEELIHTHSLV